MFKARVISFITEKKFLMFIFWRECAHTCVSKGGAEREEENPKNIFFLMFIYFEGERERETEHEQRRGRKRGRYRI